MSEHGPAKAEVEVYEPSPAVRYAAISGLQAGVAGTVVSAVQNALSSHNRGAMGVFTRTGGTIGTFAAMGASFSFVKGTVANVRETNDYVNAAAGGCAAGFLAGLRSHSLPVAVGSCAFLGATAGVYELSGHLMGETRIPETYEERRKRFFKQPRTADAQ